MFDCKKYYQSESGVGHLMIPCVESSLVLLEEDSTHGHHQTVNTKIRLIILFAVKHGEALYSQQKQDQELTMAQIMNFLLPNRNWRKWGKPLEHSGMT